MDMALVAACVPFFFGLILLEKLAGHFQGREFYRLNDSIADLSAGTGQQFFTPLVNLILIFLYVHVYDRFALFHVRMTSIWSWVGLFLLVDFLYYWFHRASHRVNFLWAAHVVHHQSEEYNLTVALRQSWIQEGLNIPLHLPLAALGFPVKAVLVMIAVDTVGQFWFHTRAIGKMGPLEWILNTPSHHRVHHGRNPKYLDKNYAGVLIIWDRMFGTWAPEEEEPVYGIVKPLGSWNPFWANVQYWVDLWRLSRRAKGLKSKLAVWILPPEKTGSPPPEVDARTVVKYDAKGTRGAQITAVVLLIASLALSRFVVERASALGAGLFGLGAALVFLLLAAIAWLTAGRASSPAAP